MDPYHSSRKRVANFSVHEKSLLEKLIKQYPILESKLTDGKSVEEKQRAWDLITDEFNCDAHVVKRNKITLKRAWVNMKTLARKIKTSAADAEPSPIPTSEEIVSIVAEASPAMMCKAILDTSSDPPNEVENSNGSRDQQKMENSSDNYDMEIEDNSYRNNDISDSEDQDTGKRKYPRKQQEIDYIKREAAVRLRHFEAKAKLEMQILKNQLETEKTKRRAAELDERRSKMLLDIAKTQLFEMSKRNINS